MPLANVVAGEGDFKGKLSRFGHGFQRSFLLSLLQELATSDDTDAPTLVLACEEPELYQHPPQARHLASVFDTLSQKNTQVLVTTHSPYFVTGRNFESVRMVRRDDDQRCSSVAQFNYEKLAKKYSEITGTTLLGSSAAMVKVHQALQPGLNEMFFTQRLILVEGVEDVAYLHTWLLLTGKWEEFRRKGCHIVAANGKSELIRPAIIAQGFGIPTITIFDADGNEKGKTKESLHQKDNVVLFNLFNSPNKDPFPVDTLWEKDFVAWPINFGKTVEAELRASIGDQKFDVLKGKACATFDYAGDLNKAALYIGTLVTTVVEVGGKCVSLDKLCSWILNFGSAQPPQKSGEPKTTTDS
jgi:predicted ATP-dependent endonuclease of OLD family